MSTCLKLALLAAIWPTSAQAAVDVEPLLDVFEHVCLSPSANFDELTASAEALGWPSVTAGNIARLAPLENTQEVKGWWASTETVGDKVIVGATKARLDGTPVETCTVAAANIAIDKFLKEFFVRTDAEKISEEQDDNWTSRLYIVFAGGRKQFVKLKFSTSSDGSGPIAASSIVEK
jgi:hypothetical protein